MNIGVDATCWQNMRGYGRYARSLLTALASLDSDNHYTFFLDSDENLDTLPKEARVRLVQANTATAIAASAKGHRSIQDMWRMSRAMSSESFDILLFPTIYTYVPVVSRAKKIVMIYDVIAEKYPALTLPKSSARLFWKAKVAVGRWQADAVATISDYSRRGLMEHFGMKEDRIHVVNAASDPVFRLLDDPQLTPRLKSLGLAGNERLVIYVGGFGPHKNVNALVSEFGKLSKSPSFADARLVLVGEYKKEIFHSYAETIQAQIEELGIADKVMFTGYLPDEELVVLLNLATVSVIPSLIEGFGLPAVEAAACGCCVIATRESPLPALLGRGCLYFDPAKPEDLGSALSRVLESDSLRRELGAAGKKAASHLTWEAAAQQMATLIRKVGAS